MKEEGLGYASKPKGLLKFHKYGPKDRRSSFEEHLLEAIRYCGNRKNTVRIHLTVSPDHLEGFQSEAARIIPRIEKETGFQLDLSFSFQKPETDTIAVDMSNRTLQESGWFTPVQTGWAWCIDPKSGCTRFRHSFYQQH